MVGVVWIWLMESEPPPWTPFPQVITQSHAKNDDPLDAVRSRPVGDLAAAFAEPHAPTNRIDADRFAVEGGYVVGLLVLGPNLKDSLKFRIGLCGHATSSHSR